MGGATKSNSCNKAKNLADLKDYFHLKRWLAWNFLFRETFECFLNDFRSRLECNFNASLKNASKDSDYFQNDWSTAKPYSILRGLEYRYNIRVKSIYCTQFLIYRIMYGSNILFAVCPHAQCGFGRWFRFDHSLKFSKNIITHH